MARQIKDVKDQKFGRLTAIEFLYILDGSAVWECKCDCGGRKRVRGASLRSGTVASCGCLIKEGNKKHGLSYNPLYKTWTNMITRCTNMKCADYKNYGARGITVCAEWLDDPAAYVKYVETHLGPKPTPKHSADRIDNEKGYEPGNLRWASSSEQNLNRRRPAHKQAA